MDIELFYSINELFFAFPLRERDDDRMWLFFMGIDTTEWKKGIAYRKVFSRNCCFAGHSFCFCFQASHIFEAYHVFLY